MLVFAQSELQRSKVVVQADLAKGLPLVRADRIQLQQVMINLIMNGIEAMRSIRDKPRILKIRSGIAGSAEVQVSVEDCGPGLDSAAADRIFDRFFTTKTGGTGLGLAISRSIVEAHGGQIWAASADPAGAVFTFTIAAAEKAN